MAAKTYHVQLASKATAAQAAVKVTVRFEAEDYHTAWVGARTVCRMGTLFKHEPQCKNPSTAREFFNLDDDEPFICSPSVWTVRHIFVAGTRKKGKRRMMTLTTEQLVDLMKQRGIELTPELQETLTTTLGETTEGGLRITIATARKLGLVEDEAGEEKAAG